LLACRNTMTPTQTLEQILYLDRDFISSFYECTSGVAATTHFTRQEGKKAGAQIPIFSAELSAVEIKSYSLSSLKMLEASLTALDRYPAFENNQGTSTSQYAWIEGKLSAAVSRRTGKDSDGKELVLAYESYFTLRQDNGKALALITVENYFASGVNALCRLQTTILKDLSLSVRALVRALPSSTHFEHRLAIPLVMMELQSDAG